MISVRARLGPILVDRTLNACSLAVPRDCGGRRFRHKSRSQSFFYSHQRYMQTPPLPRPVTVKREAGTGRHTKVIDRLFGSTIFLRRHRPQKSTQCQVKQPRSDMGGGENFSMEG